MDLIFVMLWLMVTFSGILVIANIILLFRIYFKEKNDYDSDMQIEYLRKQVSSLKSEVDALKLKNRKKKGEKEKWKIMN